MAAILQVATTLLHRPSIIRNGKVGWASRNAVVSKAHSALPGELYNQDGTARGLYDPNAQDKDSCGVGFVGGESSSSGLRRVVKRKRDWVPTTFSAFSDH
jgi:hypothetical protein